MERFYPDLLKLYQNLHKSAGDILQVIDIISNMGASMNISIATGNKNTFLR